MTRNNENVDDGDPERWEEMRDFELSLILLYRSPDGPGTIAIVGKNRGIVQ